MTAAVYNDTKPRTKITTHMVMNVIGLSLVTTFYAGLLFLAVYGAAWMLNDEGRCLNGWDAAYKPQYVAMGCSILQNGHRTPVPLLPYAGAGEP